jgi:hypothetical protein
VIDDARRVSETLGTGQHIDAPFGGTVKDVHASCRDEIERLREDRDWWKNVATDLFWADSPCNCPACDQIRDKIRDDLDIKKYTVHKESDAYGDR